MYVYQMAKVGGLQLANGDGYFAFICFSADRRSAVIRVAHGVGVLFGGRGWSLLRKRRL